MVSRALPVRSMASARYGPMGRFNRCTAVPRNPNFATVSLSRTGDIPPVYDLLIRSPCRARTDRSIAFPFLRRSRPGGGPGRSYEGRPPLRHPSIRGEASPPGRPRGRCDRPGQLIGCGGRSRPARPHAEYVCSPLPTRPRLRTAGGSVIVDLCHREPVLERPEPGCWPMVGRRLRARGTT